MFCIGCPKESYCHNNAEICDRILEDEAEIIAEEAHEELFDRAAQAAALGARENDRQALES